MQLKPYIPNAPAISRETLAVIAGAVIAAYIVGNIPSLRDWMRAQWQGNPRNSLTT